jgi:hypothetical protein
MVPHVKVADSVSAASADTGAATTADPASTTVVTRRVTRMTTLLAA